MNAVDGGIFMGAFVLALVTVVLVTVIVQAAATWRARAQLTREHEYRKLAEESVAAQSSAAAAEQRMLEDIGDIKSRLASIEKLLREVA